MTENDTTVKHRL